MTVDGGETYGVELLAFFIHYLEVSKALIELGYGGVVFVVLCEVLDEGEVGFIHDGGTGDGSDGGGN